VNVVVTMRSLRRFYTKTLLHKDAFTQRRFYTKTLLQLGYVVLLSAGVLLSADVSVRPLLVLNHEKMHSTLFPGSQS